MSTGKNSIERKRKIARELLEPLSTADVIEALVVATALTDDVLLPPILAEARAEELPLLEDDGDGVSGPLTEPLLEELADGESDAPRVGEMETVGKGGNGRGGAGRGGAGSARTGSARK